MEGDKDPDEEGNPENSQAIVVADLSPPGQDDPKNESTASAASAASKASAEEEVQRIREEMKKNLDARQEALRKMKAATKSVVSKPPVQSPPSSGHSGRSTDRSAGRKTTVQNMSDAASAFGGGPKLTTPGIDAAVDFNKKVEDSSVKGEEDKPAEPEETEQQKEIKEMSRRRRRTKRPLTRIERRWRLFTYLNVILDLPINSYFIYLGFVIHSADTAMDPLAWQISFGCIVLFCGVFKNLQIFMGWVTWFYIFLVFVGPLVVGYFYASVRYFLWVYEGDFPCFRGAKEMDYEYDMCYKGRLLVAFTTATLYTNYSTFYLWRWLNFTIEMMQRRGELIDELSVEMVLESVEQQLEKQRQATYEQKQFDAEAQAMKAVEANRIAGKPVRGRGRSKKAAAGPVAEGIQDHKIDVDGAAPPVAKRSFLGFRNSQSIAPGSLQPHSIQVGASKAE